MDHNNSQVFTNLPLRVRQEETDTAEDLEYHLAIMNLRARPTTQSGAQATQVGAQLTSINETTSGVTDAVPDATESFNEGSGMTEASSRAAQALRERKKTDVCGVHTPGKGLPVPVTSTKNPDWTAQCPRCMKFFSRAHTVKQHFPGCVDKWGNPDGLYWYDALPGRKPNMDSRKPEPVSELQIRIIDAATMQKQLGIDMDNFYMYQTRLQYVLSNDPSIDEETLQASALYMREFKSFTKSAMEKMQKIHDLSSNLENILADGGLTDEGESDTHTLSNLTTPLHPTSVASGQGMSVESVMAETEHMVPPPFNDPPSPPTVLGERFHRAVARHHLRELGFGRELFYSLGLLENKVDHNSSGHHETSEATTAFHTGSDDSIHFQYGSAPTPGVYTPNGSPYFGGDSYIPCQSAAEQGDNQTWNEAVSARYEPGHTLTPQYYTQHISPYFTNGSVTPRSSDQRIWANDDAAGPFNSHGSETPYYVGTPTPHASLPEFGENTPRPYDRDDTASYKPSEESDEDTMDY